MAGKEFFRKAMTYTKQGNVGMALGNLAGALTAKGFGWPVHIIPDVGLSMVMEAMVYMRELGLPPGLPEHFPHPIYKPPKGEPLGIHHDQMAPRDLLRNLNAHVASDDPSTTAWVQKHGIQMLAHLQGGTGTEDGATFVVGPMTPLKLLTCLRAYGNGEVGGDYRSWLEKPVGKIDLDWEGHLDAFNLILRNAGLDPIGLVPASPMHTQRDGNREGFIVAFPVGWPHGSFSNHKNEAPAQGRGSRITITLPITMRGSSQVADPRIPERLRMMAVLSSGGHTKAQYEAAEDWLVHDTEPYARGKTHKKPYKVLNLIRHPDAPGATGPFHRITVKSATVEQYLRFLNTIAVVPPALDTRAAVSNTAVWHEPPSIDVLDGDVRIVKVKQPWANELVRGRKDVENRTWCLGVPYPAWILVASSAARPTSAMMADRDSRLAAQGVPEYFRAMDADPGEYTYGAIIGMIRLKGCYDVPPTPSVWYNPPDKAWVVDDAWEFDEPIPLDPDDGMQTQAALAIRPQYRAAVEEQMGRLEPAYR